MLTPLRITLGTRDAPRVQLVGDQDSFLPRSMASSIQAGAKRSPAETSRGVASSGITIRDRGSSSFGQIQPSKGAEDVYVQARTLFRAMVQIPHYSEEVNAVPADCIRHE